MLGLVLKDFKIVKARWYFIVVAVVMAVCMGVASVYTRDVPDIVAEIYQVSFFAMAMMWSFFSMVVLPITIEESGRTNYVIRSMPFTSWDETLAKYVYGMIIFILTAVIGKLSGAAYLAFTGNLNFNNLNVHHIGIVLIVYVILMSAYIPLNKIFGTMKMKYINSLIYMILILLPTVGVSKLNKMNPEKLVRFGQMIQDNLETIKIVFIVGVAAIFVASMFITNKFGKYLKD